MTLMEFFVNLLGAHRDAIADGVPHPSVQILLEVEMFSEIQAANGDVQEVSYHEGVVTISGTALQGEAQ